MKRLVWLLPFVLAPALAQEFVQITPEIQKYTQDKAKKYAKGTCTGDYMATTISRYKTPADLAKAFAREQKSVTIASPGADLKKFSSTDGKTFGWVIYPSAQKGFKYIELKKDGVHDYFCSFK